MKINCLKEIPYFGIIFKNSGDFLIRSAIEMAFELFEAQQKIKDNEKNYRDIFDSSNDAIFIHDSATGVIVNVNKTMLTMYGYSDKDDVLKGDPERFSASEKGYSAAKTGEMIKKTLASGANSFEWLAKKKSGELFWVEVVLHKIEIAGIKHIMASVRDITERKKNEREILNKNEELTAANEEMEAANEELIAVNEEMEAANEELIAVNQELQIAEERYRGVVETQTEMIARFLDNGYITFVNRSWQRYYEKFLGIREDVTGKNIKDIMQINDYPAVQAYLDTLKPGELSTSMERAFVSPSGETRWQLWYIQKIVYETTEITEFQVVGHDITERKLTEAALLESETKFKSVIELAPDAILLGSPDGIIIGINQRAIELTGYSHDELIGNNIQVFFTDKEQNKTPLRYDLLKQGKVVINERILTRKDGSEVFIEMNSKMMPDMTYQTFIRDITERKLAEETISAEKERLSVTLRSIGDGVITTDTEGKVVIMNKVAEDLTGWQQSEAEGKPLSDIFHIINEINRNPCENPVKSVLETGNNIDLANHTLLISRDGTERIVADSGAPIKDKNSTTIGVVLVFRDMTEKRKLLEAIQQTDKLNSLGVLAGGIAHDFNNLLSGIFGYIEMARLKSVSDKTVSDYLDKAFTVFNRARDLTQQLLTFSKGGTPVRKTADIGILIKDSASFALSGSNIICDYNFEEDLRLCDFDENQMAQVIDNIIINAKQAMPIGGIIDIRANNCSLSDHDNPILKGGNYVKISISDTGIGIPADLIKRIFDPFFTTKQQGTGLGLATCYSIIQKHDGYIEAESIPGDGTTFHIFLPASQKMPETDFIRQSSEHNGSGTILIMDDEDFIREIAGELIEIMGYKPLFAKEGEEALKLCADASDKDEPVVAALLDLTIPGGMGGKETVTELKKMYPHIPVFASSGFSEDYIMSHPSEYGFTASIRKPYRKNELAELLNRYLSINSPG